MPQEAPELLTCPQITSPVVQWDIPCSLMVLAKDEFEQFAPVFPILHSLDDEEE